MDQVFPSLPVRQWVLSVPKRLSFFPQRDPEALAAVQQQVRARGLRWFARAGPLDPADALDMAGWHHGGASRYGRCA